MKKLLIITIFILIANMVYATSGDGSAEINPNTMATGRTGYYVSVTYTLLNAFGSGELVFVRPNGFANLTYANMTITASNVGLSGWITDGKSVTLTGINLGGGETISMNIIGLTAPAPGIYIFGVYSDPGGEGLGPIAPQPFITTTLQDWNTSMPFGSEIRGFYTNVSQVVVNHNWKSDKYNVMATDDGGNCLIRRERNSMTVTFTAVDLNGNTIPSDIEYRIRR